MKGFVLDLSGQRFGRLIAIRRAENECPTVTRWLCKCDCGKEIVTRTTRLRNGSTKSCGCLQRQLSGERLRTHGISHSPTGSSWNMMINRCRNRKISTFSKYGGRGIKVCEFLFESPVNLISVIGERPPGTSIDRTNNSGHYSCGTCPECLRMRWPLNIRWATGKQQCRNKGNNHNVTIGLETKCMAEWAEQIGIPFHTFKSRVKRGLVGNRLLAPLNHL